MLSSDVAVTRPHIPAPPRPGLPGFTMDGALLTDAVGHFFMCLSATRTDSLEQGLFLFCQFLNGVVSSPTKLREFAACPEYEPFVGCA